MPTYAQIPGDILWAYQLASGTSFGTYNAALAAAVALSAANGNASVSIFQVEYLTNGPNTGAAVNPSHPSNFMSPYGWFVQLSSSAASGTFTLGGTPTTTFNNVYTIGGTAVTVAQATGNTLTQQAAADVVAINANPVVAALVTASNVAGVVTVKAVTPGASGNAITTTASTTGGDTLTANQTQLSGGTANLTNPEAAAVVAAQVLSAANANAPVQVGRPYISVTAP
jgi:hypothetical protein